MVLLIPNRYTMINWLFWGNVIPAKFKYSHCLVLISLFIEKISRIIYKIFIVNWKNNEPFEGRIIMTSRIKEKLK